MTDEHKNYLSERNNIGDTIVINGRTYTLIEPISTEGFKSIVWKGLDEFGIPVAIKFATHDDYIENSFLAEISRANTLYAYEQFAKYFGAQTMTFKNEEIKCIVFIEQWIEGINLSKFSDISLSFINGFVTQFCEILNILKENNLRHDDLHANNILIVKPPKGTLQTDLKIKIIDMGSLKDYSEPLKSSKNGVDDLKNFCIQLSILSNKLLFYLGQRKILSKEEKLIRNEIKKLLSVTANDYWHYHYQFDETSAFKKKNIGTQMINNIIINTIVPIVFAYGYFKNEPEYKTKALQWMEELQPEKNSITGGWEKINIENKNAFDSQALIELKNSYCDKKRCLECAVGNAIMKEKS